MNSAERLKHIRKILKLTQDSLAKSMGLKRDNITSIESGKVKFSILHALAIEYIHGVRKEWLLNGDGDYFVDPSKKINQSSKINKIEKKEIVTGFKEPEKGMKNIKHLIGIESASQDLYEKVSDYLKTTHDAAQIIKKEEHKKIG